MKSSPPGSSDHGISQGRILELIAISFSRGSPDPGIKTTSPALAGRFFYHCAIREAMLGVCTLVHLRKMGF